VVIKLTGTVPLPNHFWLTAGPVWHTGTRLNGDGFVPDVDFDDAVGGMVGFGWRWVGVSYIRTSSIAPLLGQRRCEQRRRHFHLEVLSTG